MWLFNVWRKIELSENFKEKQLETSDSSEKVHAKNFNLNTNHSEVEVYLI